MNAELDPRYAQALRAELVTRSTQHRRGLKRGSTRSIAIATLSLGALAATGAATAALLGDPGALAESQISPIATQSGSGSGALVLDAPTSSASVDAVHFEFMCLSAGDFSLGGQGLAITCEAGDEGQSVASGLMPLEALREGSIEVKAEQGTTWRLEGWYVETDRVPLAVNDAGETYGIESDELVPDLIQAEATNGRIGYVRRTELDAASGPPATSPAGASTSTPQAAIIDVYLNDGVTVVGEFAID